MAHTAASRIGAGVGFIGIGNMGLPMALRLLDAGHAVWVRDIDASRTATAAASGATVCASAAELGERCATVIVAVVDEAQTEDVLFGAGGAAPSLAQHAGATVVLCPTVGPACTERAAARLAALGVACVDAPMSGGPARACDGSMSLMVACSDAAFEAQRALLETLSSKLFRVGTRPGDGARTKLVNNLLAAINLAGAAEAMALAERVGLDAVRTLDVIEQSSGQSWIGSERMRRALAGDLAPRAHTTLLAKDSRLALEMAAAAGAPVSVGTVAARAFADAVAAGHASLDDASLLDFFRVAERGAGR